MKRALDRPMTVHGRSAQFATLLVAAVVGAWVGAGVGVGQVLVAVVPAVVLLCLVVFVWPAAGILVMVASYFIGDRLIGQGILPLPVRWTSDLVLVVMLVRVLAGLATEHRAPWLPRALVPGLTILLAACLASSFLNHQSILEMVIGLRYYLRFPLLFLVLGNLRLSERTYRLVIGGLLLLALVQVPITALQFIARGEMNDLNSGTLDLFGGQELLFVCLSCMIIGLTLVLRGNRSILEGALWTALLLPPVFAGVQAAFVLVPALLLTFFVLSLAKWREPRRVTATLALLLVFWGGGLVFLWCSCGQSCRRSSGSQVHGTSEASAP